MTRYLIGSTILLISLYGLIYGSILKNPKRLWPFGIIPVKFGPEVPGIKSYYFKCALSKIQNQTNLLFYEVFEEKSSEIPDQIPPTNTSIILIQENATITHQNIDSLANFYYREIYPRVPVHKINPVHVNFNPINLYCSSSVGYRPSDDFYFNSTAKSGPFVNIGILCRYGGILHELCHVIGLQHTHQREDRDDYIQINWENLKNPELNENQVKWNFATNNSSHFSHLGLSYDFSSIMHYGRSYRGIPDVISPRNRSELEIQGKSFEGDPDKIGDWNTLNWDYSWSVWKRIELSKGDVLLINKAYEDKIKERSSSPKLYEEHMKELNRTGQPIEANLDCF